VSLTEISECPRVLITDFDVSCMGTLKITILRWWSRA